ncbi:MAG: type I-B CRISPR-associated protein Cas7/Csh2, partial [Candidatus Heimdallarchaeota archaeon]|nr:type I-B CRISPR-associated protein Cas7/Csh2 [Candidatus Heimdallarchaeota archaeon]
MTNELKNRREIVFLYDVKDANPNGDPDDSNRPRTDKDNYNIVTDVRLKRTIRDYWLSRYGEQQGKGILVKKFENEGGNLSSMADLITRALNLPESINKEQSGEIKSRIRSEVPANFIDVRFFGAAITLKGANVSITGPTQFGIGRSLNKPRITTHTITTTFSSGEDKQAGTFGETHVVEYSIIAFPGIVSETSAKDTHLSDDDLNSLWEGLWYGTKELNTRSKFNHNPRLLLSVVSKPNEFQIGGLSRLLSIDDENIDEIKSEKDVIIDVTQFM